jgi:phosphoribosylformimino-5-aminoimidazole carboxamide ribotide isomerase
MVHGSFEVIPVIDVKGSRAVRAVAGDRARYLPLETPLAPGTSDPARIASAFQRLFPFRTLYVADLDGIEGRGANGAMQARVAAAWAGAVVWIDDGASLLPTVAGITKVIGSETCPSLDDRPDPGSILSLDFRGVVFQGPAALLESPDLWPERVIVMTMARVGMGNGPDFDQLEAIIREAGPARKVYAAGGVRNGDDLRRLRTAGAAGVLVATALHNGQIKTGDLEEVAGG